MCFIGIDIGTSSICGVLYDSTNKSTESITIENSAVIESKNDWEKIQDTAKIIQILDKIINGFLSKSQLVKGIGFTGQMHGILYLNKEGNSVSPLFTWQDGRGNLIHKSKKTYVEFLSDNTNYKLSTGFGLVTHFYNIENNLVSQDAVKICTIMDYAVMKFSGRKVPLIDFSNAASLGFFDLEKFCFDTEALTRLGINPAILPETKESATLAGYYNKNIPVYSAIGDNQASFLGSVKDKKRSVHITVGTSSQISIYSDKYLEIAPLDTRPFPGGGYILVGAALCGGKSFALLKSFFEATVNLFVGTPAEKIDFYCKMTAISDSFEANELPVVNTAFDGTRADPQKQGSISNISINNFTPENLIVAFLQGICNELYDFYNLIPEEFKANKVTIVGSGNAIKTNKLLIKIFEQKFKCNLNISKHTEEAAFGACMCAVAREKYTNGFFGTNEINN
ncbi:MAG: hypothetical protein L3J11_10015 [Draconibacterium sp.]|nr:hypothetical protein [Draconibacterium sp.]